MKTSVQFLLLVITLLLHSSSNSVAQTPKPPVGKAQDKPTTKEKFAEWTHYLKLTEAGEWNEFSKVDGLAFRDHFWPQRNEPAYATNAAYWFMCGSGLVNWSVRQQGLSEEQKQAHYHAALPLVQRAAELGHGQAMTELAWMLADGLGTDADLKAALAWAERALVRVKQRFGEGSLELASAQDELAFSTYLKVPDLERTKALAEAALRTRVAKLGWDDKRTRMTARALATLVLLPRREAGEAERLLRMMLAKEDTKVVGDSLELVSTLRELANCIELQGRLAEAEPLFLRALGIVRRIAEGSEEHLALLDRMGMAYLANEKLPQAEKYLSESISLQRKHLPVLDSATAGTLLDLAQVLLLQGKQSNADTAIEESLAVWAAATKKTNDFVTYAAHLSDVGHLLCSGSQLEKGADLLRQAVGLFKSASAISHPAYHIVLSRLALVHEAKGQLDRTQAIMEESIVGLRQHGLTNTFEFANALSFLGRVRNLSGPSAEAVALHLSATDVWRGLEGNSGLHYAGSLRQLGQAYSAIGDSANALTAYDRALAIHKATNQLEYALTLSGKAACLNESGQATQAGPLYEEALRIQRKHLTNQHPQLAETLLRLAPITLQKDRSLAARMCGEALTISAAATGGTNIAFADAQTRASWVFQELGQHDKARKLLTNALALEIKLLSPDHFILGRTHQQLGKLRAALNDPDGALQSFRDALQIQRFERADLRIDRVLTLQDMGDHFAERLNLKMAIECFQEAVTSAQSTSRPVPMQIADLQSKLSLLYLFSGSYSRSTALLNEALPVLNERAKSESGVKAYVEWLLMVQRGARLDQSEAASAALSALQAIDAQAVDRSAPEYLMTTSGLLDALALGGNEAVVTRYANQIIAAWGTRLKQQQYEHAKAYAIAQSCLARLEASRGEFAKAEDRWTTARDLLKQHNRELDHVQVGVAFGLLDLAIKRGDLRAAVRQFEELLGRLGQADLAQIPLLRNVVSPMGSLLSGVVSFLDGDSNTAYRNLKTSVGALRQFSDAMALGSSERQQLEIANRFGFSLSYLTAAGVDLRLPAFELYPPVLIGKGATYTAQARRRLQHGLGGSPQQAERYRKLASQWTALVANQSASSSADKATAASVFSELEALEVEMMVGTTNQPPASKLSTADIQAVLRNDEAVLDFVELTKPYLTPAGSPSSHQGIGVFVLRSTGAVEFRILGDRGVIADTIARWHRALTNANGWAAEQAEGSRLRELLWDPLALGLQGVKTVLVSSEGALHRLPLGALPGAKPNSYLLEEVNFVSVPAVQHLRAILAGSGKTNAQQLLVVGGVAYGNDPLPQTALASATKSARLPIASQTAQNSMWPNWLSALMLRSGGSGRTHFTPLAHSQEEAQSVARSYLTLQGKTVKLGGVDATEASVKSAAPQARWIHLATHGFYASQPLPESRDVTASLAAGISRLTGQQQATWTLSGVALAGANTPNPQSDEDGIWTAAEVLATDLRGVELVTLSACETALGKETSGEAMLGLQRAFLVSGARTVVGSLWKVDDQWTMELMKLFYDNLWNKRMEKLESLRQAQLEIKRRTSDLRERPAPGMARPPGSPLFWGGFQLSGAWR